MFNSYCCLHCFAVCGTRRSGTVEPTHGGWRAKPGEFPWQVLLITEQGLGGGLLLYDNWVLTAARVVVDQRNPSALRIKLGILNKRSFCYEEAQAGKIVIHKGYKNNPVNFDNDIVLVRLEHKVSISTNITPICSPGKVDFK